MIRSRLSRDICCSVSMFSCKRSRIGGIKEKWALFIHHRMRELGAALSLCLVHILFPKPSLLRNPHRLICRYLSVISSSSHITLIPVPFLFHPSMVKPPFSPSFHACFLSFCYLATRCILSVDLQKSLVGFCWPNVITLYFFIEFSLHFL